MNTAPATLFTQDGVGVLVLPPPSGQAFIAFTAFVEAGKAVHSVRPADYEVIQNAVSAAIRGTAFERTGTWAPSATQANRRTFNLGIMLAPSTALSLTRTIAGNITANEGYQGAVAAV